MPYTTSTEVQSDFKDIVFDSTKNVTDTDVTQFIVEADALIDAYVGGRYVVPVSASGEGLSLLKLLSRSIVTARIKAIMEVKQAKSADANQNVVSVLISMKQIMQMLMDIRDGKMVLAGADLLVSSGGFFSNNNQNDVSPVVQKDVKQW